jgi:hypothetical protein
VNAPDPLRHLAEDAASPAEAEALRPLLQNLRAWPAPVPTPAATQRLVAALAPALPSARPTLTAAWPWLLLRAQVRVVRGELWLASALVLLLGALVTLALGRFPADAASLPFALLAPLVTAVGCAVLFGPASDPALELELATPASPRLVLLARLALVFAFNLALGLAGSAALAALRADVLLWPLVQAWLAPMAFLSALAFMLSVVFVEPLVGVLASLGLWGLQVLRPAILGGVGLWRYLPDLASAETRGLLWLAAALLLLTALWLGGREERFLHAAP